MSFRQFAFGLTATFGIAWLAVVIVPFFLMRSPQPVAFDEVRDGKTGNYHPKTAGRVANGERVYAENGCYLCHTQLIRPSYAGNDLARPGWAGVKKDEETGRDTRRESNVYDYMGGNFARIGVSRLGPDLSNLGLRVESIYAKDTKASREWLYLHLYNPRANPERPTSKCPPFAFLFEEKKVTGQTPANALPLETEGTVIVPKPEAEMLVDYLLSLKRDDILPAKINPAPAKPAGDNQG